MVEDRLDEVDEDANEEAGDEENLSSSDKCIIMFLKQVNDPHIVNIFDLCSNGNISPLKQKITFKLLIIFIYGIL